MAKGWREEFLVRWVSWFGVFVVVVVVMVVDEDGEEVVDVDVDAIWGLSFWGLEC